MGAVKRSIELGILVTKEGDGFRHAATEAMALRGTMQQLDGATEGAANSAGRARTRFDFAAAAMTALGILIAGAMIKAFSDVQKFMRESVVAFEQYENKMNEIFTLIPGSSAKMRTELTEDIIILGKELGRMPEEVSQAVYNALSVRIPPENVFEHIRLANIAARAGVGDLTETLKTGLNVVNSYGQEVISLEEVYALMFQAIKGGELVLGDFLGNMANITAVSGEMGVHFGAITSAMSQMTIKGGDAKEVVKQLEQLLIEISTPGKQLAEHFERIAGVNFREFAKDRGPEVLLDAVILLNKHAELTGDSVANLFDGKFYREVLARQALLMLASDTEVLGQKVHDATQETSALYAAFNEFSDSSLIVTQRVQSTTEALKLAIGEALMPTRRFWNENRIAMNQNIETLIRLRTQWATNQLTYAELLLLHWKFTLGLVDSNTVLSVAAQKEEDLRNERILSLTTMRYYIQLLEDWEEQEFENMHAAKAAYDAITLKADALAKAEIAYANLNPTLQESTEGIESFDRAMTQNLKTMEEAPYEPWRKQIEFNAAVQRDLRNETDTYSVSLEMLNKVLQRRIDKDKLAAETLQHKNQVFGTAVTALDQYIIVTDESTEYTFSLRDSFFEALAAAGMHRDILLEAATATGTYDEATLRLMFSHAAMVEAIDTVVKLMRDGTIKTFEEGWNVLDVYQRKLAEDYTLVFDYEQLKDVDNYVDGLLTRIREVAKTHHIHFDITQSGNLPGSVLPPGAGTPTEIPNYYGGRIKPNQPYMVGDFHGRPTPHSEIIIPDQPGYVVNAREAQQFLAGNTNSTTIENLNIEIVVDQTPADPFAMGQELADRIFVESARGIGLFS